MRVLRHAYIVLGGLALAAGLLLPWPRAHVLAYQVMAAVGLAGLVAGVLAQRPRRRRGWWLLIVGFAWFYLGDVLFALYADVLHVSPDGTLADVSYLAGYPFVVAGLLSLVRSPALTGRWGQEREAVSLIDVGVVTLGLFLFGWAVLLDPLVDNSALPLPTRLLAVAYPLADLPVIAVVVPVLLGRGRRGLSAWLLVASIAAMSVADVLYALEALGGSGLYLHQALPTYDLFYLVFWFLAGAAALHPSMAAASEPGQLGPAPLTGMRLALLATASVAGPLSLLLEAVRRPQPELLVEIAGSAAIALLLLARLVGQVAVADRVQADRRRLLERLIHVSEEERTRVALEIHDGPLQILTQVNLELERVQRMLARGELERGTALLGVGQRRLSDEIQGLRRLMVSLRPPALDEVGLEPALRDWLAQLERHTGVRCELRAEVGRLDPALETTIYRAVQETLTDATRGLGGQPDPAGPGDRAGARAHDRGRAVPGRVLVVLRGDDRRVELEVHDDAPVRAAAGPARDDSVAAAVAASGLWLDGVRERIELAGGTWTAPDGEAGPRVAARFGPAPIARARSTG
jgi:signal transduction histidine kinase